MAEKKNEVATVEQKFNLQTMDGDLATAISEEMDGLGAIPFDRVKIPSGGGLAFEVPSEDEDNPDMEKELVGVILHHHPINAYWKDKFNGSNDSPDCASMDGKVGTVKASGECKNCEGCPYNQFTDDGSGKACKNMHRIYFLREGNPVPLLITLPPTSLKFLRDYIGKKIVLKGMRSWDAITKITLKREKSKDGIDYSRAAFMFVDTLDESQRESARQMAMGLKARNSEIEIESSDYEMSTRNDDGFVNVPNGVDDELPFK